MLFRQSFTVGIALFILSVGFVAGEPYLLGPGDVVRVTVLGHDDLLRTLTVAEDGTIFFPLLGRVQAAGLSYDQLAENLSKALSEGFVINPQVNVEVVEYNSKKVYVLGEVDKPWTERKAIYNLRARTTLLEMIAEVGGPSKNASDYVVVVRRLDRNPGNPKDATTTKSEDAGKSTELKADQKTSAEGKRASEPGKTPLSKNDAGTTPEEEKIFQAREDTTSIKIKLADLFSGDLSLNIELRNGDLILFPPKVQDDRRVIIAGAAGRVGPVALTENMTLPELISMVQAPVGESDELTVYRSDEKGKSETQTFLTKDVLLKKAAVGFQLKDGDVLFFKKTPQTFYVIGEVKAPGAFYWRADLTVREALVHAGWTTPAAAVGRIKVMRMTDGKWVESSVQLDDKVQPGDILSVPERWF